MRLHKPKVLKPKLLIPKGRTVAEYIKEFDRPNQLKPVRYVSNDHN